MDEYPELIQFAEFLTQEDIPQGIRISFTAIDADGPAIEIECSQKGITRDLAEFWGCPKNQWPSDSETGFTSEDSWAGNGTGNLDELAKELSALHESDEPLDLELSVREILRLAEKHA